VPASPVHDGALPGRGSRLDTTSGIDCAPCFRAAPLRAVVIGAGLAGLTTAHCLAALFDEVTLVERDDISATPADPAAATNDQAHVRIIPSPCRGLLHVLQSVICDRQMFDCLILRPICHVTGRAAAVANDHNPVASSLTFMQPPQRSPRTTSLTPFRRRAADGAQPAGRAAVLAAAPAAEEGRVRHERALRWRLRAAAHRRWRGARQLDRGRESGERVLLSR